jgi:hypothetical protein
LVRCWKCFDLAISPDKTLLYVFGMSIYVRESVIMYEWSFAKYQSHSRVVPSVFAQWTQDSITITDDNRKKFTIRA